MSLVGVSVVGVVYPDFKKLATMLMEIRNLIFEWPLLTLYTYLMRQVASR